MPEWNRCDICGRFIPYEDFASGDATNIMVLPDSDLSTETWETYCRIHVRLLKEETEESP